MYPDAATRKAQGSGSETGKTADATRKGSTTTWKLLHSQTLPRPLLVLPLPLLLLLLLLLLPVRVRLLPPPRSHKGAFSGRFYQAISAKGGQTSASCDACVG